MSLVGYGFHSSFQRTKKLKVSTLKKKTNQLSDSYKEQSSAVKIRMEATKHSFNGKRIWMRSNKMKNKSPKFHLNLITEQQCYSLGNFLRKTHHRLQAQSTIGMCPLEKLYFHHKIS